MIKDALKTDELNPLVLVGDGSEDLLCSEGEKIGTGQAFFFPRFNLNKTLGK